MSRTRSHRTCLWLLLAAALFLRAVVPQGYMPERSTAGSIALTLCNSDGVWLVPLNHDGDKPDKSGQRADPPCAFAGLGAPAVPPPASEALPPLAPVPLAFAPAPDAPEQSGQPRLLPPARGPPLPA